MSERPNYLQLLDRPIAFQRAFVPIAGSVAGAVFLSQLVYWCSRCDRPEGVYKTAAQWEEETGISEDSQRRIRKVLKEKGILIETEKRLEHRIYFRLDEDVLNEHLESYLNEKPTKQARFANRYFNGSGGVKVPVRSITPEITSKITYMEGHAKNGKPKPEEQNPTLSATAIPPSNEECSAAASDLLPAGWQPEHLPIVTAFRTWFDKEPPANFRTVIQLLLRPKGMQGARADNGKLYSGYTVEQVVQGIERAGTAGHHSPNSLILHVAGEMKGKEPQQTKAQTDTRFVHQNGFAKQKAEQEELLRKEGLL